MRWRGLQRDNEHVSGSAQCRPECLRQSERCQQGAAASLEEGARSLPLVLLGLETFLWPLDIFISCIQLQDIAALTNDVKNQAMTALEKAQKKKDYFENNNKNLKDFIKTIRNFLTGLFVCFSMQVESYSNILQIKIVGLFCPLEEGADPDSIQKVASQVMDIKLPFNLTTLNKIIMQIKDSLSNLSNVEGVVNQTSHLIQTAQELLEKAKEAK